MATKRKAAAEAAAPASAEAETPTLVADLPEVVALLHHEILPSEFNPRKDFDDDGLAELAESIGRDGLLENLVVRPGAYILGGDLKKPAPTHTLVAGERRWRAIGRLIEANLWPATQRIICNVRQMDDVTHRRIALVENLQRRDLKPLEEAKALQQLVEIDGRSTEEIATDIGFTQRWAQQRLQLLQLSPAMQQRMAEGELKVEPARITVAIWDKLPPVKKIELEQGKITPEAAKQWLDQQPTPLSDAAKLAVMELWEKLAAAPYKAGYSGKATKIVGMIERTDRGDNGTSIKVRVDDPKNAFAELRKRNLVDEPGRVTDEGVETGEAYVSTGYNGEYYLRQAFPSALDAKFRKANIPTLRVQVYGLQVDYAAGQSEGYATPWLETPPFTPAPEVSAEISAKKAARLEREQKARDDQAARDAEQRQAAQQRAARIEASAQLEPELRQAFAVSPGAFTGSLAARSADLGWTLPLFLSEDGAITDSAGQGVTEYVYPHNRYDRLPFLRFLVAAVNVAAGLETPTSKPVPMDPDAMPREDFLAQVVTSLIEESDEEGAPMPYASDVAEVLAERALDALLAEEGWVYGEADTYDWDINGARSLAGAIQRGEYADDDANYVRAEPQSGEQIDIEDAIAGTADPADDEVEMTPALARLAGVQEAAE
jgi:ParB family chromosome partitioning protein